jgi:hypothetical protein
MNKITQKLLLPFLLVSGLAFAASTYTTHFNLQKPAAGDEGWADALNTNANVIDAQMYINQQSTQDHINDPVAAHAATAIEAEPGGLVCTLATTAQEFLECLDSNLGALTTGAVVTLNTEQTIVGQKTFEAPIIAEGGIDAAGAITLSGLSTGLVHSDSAGELSSSLLVNDDVSASAAIEYSKLDLVDSIVNADINSSAAIDYSKLALTGSIVDADVNASAAIATSKLAPLSTSRAAVTDGSGFLAAATTTATEIGYVNGVTSAIQTQLNGKQATGNYITSLTTDVVASGAGAAAATIQSNVVTNAKLAQMPTLTIKGNNTGGTANALDLSAAQVNSMLGSLSNPMNAQGDVIYGGASGTPTKLAVGTASKVLRSDGTNPVYDYPEPTIAAKTSGYTLVANDNLVTGDATSAAFTLTLPAAAAGNSGKRYNIKKTDTSFNAITVTDGTLSTTLNTQNELIEVYSTGSAWLVLSRVVPSVWVSYAASFSAGMGTVTPSHSFWKRVGDSILVRGRATSGTPTAAIATISLPGTLTIDSTKEPSTSYAGTFVNQSVVGNFCILAAAGAGNISFGWVSGPGALSASGGTSILGISQAFSWGSHPISITGWNN